MYFLPLFVAFAVWPLLCLTEICEDGAISIMDCLSNDCPGGYQCVQGSCCRIVSNSTFDHISRDDPSDGSVSLGRREESEGAAAGSKFSKDGICPKIDHFPKIPGLVECKDDFDCDGLWKCCATPSGSYCFDIQHPDAAHSSVKNRQRSSEPSNCVADDDCKPPSKCLTTRRGRVCASPSRNPRSCPKSEDYVSCASSCQTGCTKDDLYLECEDSFCRPGCICRPGFIRLYHNDWKSSCIPLLECVEIRKQKALELNYASSHASVPCQSSAQCPDQQYCRNNICSAPSTGTSRPLNGRGSECASKVDDGALLSREFFCTADHECPPGKLCYQTRQGGRCRGVEARKEPQLCPEGRPATSRCVNGECSAGFRCFQGICCPPPSTANYASTSRSNRCPKVQVTTGRGLVHFCDADADCFPNENCCSTNTGRQCVNLAVGSSVEASTQRCSDGSRSLQVCYGDLECGRTMRCENGLCCPKQTGRQSKGVCPPVFSDYGAADDAVDRCQSDEDCASIGRKCCPTLSGKHCLVPMDIRKSPTRHQHTCLDGSLAISQCDLDQCPSGYFCESGFCCRRTTISNYEPFGANDLCPPLSFMENLTSFPTCITSDDCSNMAICCPTRDRGRRCVQPDRRKYLARTESVCHKESKPLGIVPLRCENDSNCPDKAICCSIKGVRVCTGS